MNNSVVQNKTIRVNKSSPNRGKELSPSPYIPTDKSFFHGKKSGRETSHSLPKKKNYDIQQDDESICINIYVPSQIIFLKK